MCLETLFTVKIYMATALKILLCLPFSFQIPKEEVTVVIEDDGTVVDDEAFFKKLPAQTVFIFLRPGETWRGGMLSIIHTQEQK